MPFRFRAILCCAAALALPSCVDTSTIHPDSLVVVRDSRLPKNEPAYTHFARHSWVDYRPDTHSDWTRVEIMNDESGLLRYKINQQTAHEKVRWGRRVRVIAQSSAAENPHFAKDIESFVQHYDASVYHAWPGPNSNTFAERLLRAIDGVDAQLGHNAVGKDYGFYAGKTAGGTGVELQMTVLGAAVGLREGVEVNALGLSAGVSLAPLALKLPFLPEISRENLLRD